MEKDSKYQAYAGTKSSEVNELDMVYLITLLIKEAEVNMGCSSDEQTIERVIYHIRKDFSWLPVCYIASAFVRGSLGKFGAGRLVPRTIHGWLFEVGSEYNRDLIKERQKELDSEVYTRMDLRKYPVGKAIIQKIDWYKAGELQGDDWDRISLKDLAEAIGRKEVIEFSNFYK